MNFLGAMVLSADVEYPITLNAPQQGVSVTFQDKEQLLGFVDEEIRFWSRSLASLQSHTSNQPVLSSINALVGNLHNYLSRLRDSPTAKGVEEILREMSSVAIFSTGFLGELFAEVLEKLPAAGPGAFVAALGMSTQSPQAFVGLTGARVNNLDLAGAAYVSAKLSEISAGPKAKRKELTSLLTTARRQVTRIENQHQQLVDWFEKTSIALEEKGRIASQTYLEKIEKVDEQIDQYRQETSERIEEEIKAVTDRMKRMEGIYNSKKVLEGPSALWKDVETRANLSIGFSLGAFILLTALPLGLIWLNASSIHSFLLETLTSAQPGTSLTAIAVVTAPAFLYGWILRHLSRIFIHNMSLQSDAQYRAVLATTFIGLAEQKSAAVTDAERALVLNALFRPSPPNSSNDDGPPSGILEIIKAK
ncbi:DUF6161 domain-containing protein [Paradevosia shaoguanensis]|uniref:DUF6161 domain-containing protein n=1 Tax=Paradevosia shaoguanensis TaxID=1335043 RepID=A0AA41UCW0_9HYPH|nr:DUF6161 domain-containing protein [Paradevosia shaoguanensis]MCI0128667.1 DUF6161 domain-containing protein [Paradevosia shaoguanensis]